MLAVSTAPDAASLVTTRNGKANDTDTYGRTSPTIRRHVIPCALRPDDPNRRDTSGAAALLVRSIVDTDPTLGG
jgi:hypothetical protein